VHRLDVRSAWALALGLLAGWVAAGSCGVLVTSLQSLIVWLLLSTCAVLIAPRWSLGARAIVAVSLAVVLLVPPAMGPSPLQLPLLVVVVMGLLALGKHGLERRLLCLSASAVLTLVLVRFLQLQVPAIWLLSDRLGSMVGQAAGLAGRPLRLGATFAGLDLLVVTTFFIGGSLGRLRAPRWAPAFFALAVVAIAQAAYVAVLALTSHLRVSLPPSAVPLYDSPYIPPEFCWPTIARQGLPWYLPACGAILQATAIGLILRWSPWRSQRQDDDDSPAGASQSPMGWTVVAFALAALLPCIGVVRGGASRLDGKRIIANVQEDIDYLVPEHDQYGQASAGMFGLLPDFVESLGGEFRTVPQLTSEELQGADVLLLLHPSAAIGSPEVIRDYVGSGGSLLLVTSGFHPEVGLDEFAARLLQPSAISIRPDAAISASGLWQESFRASLHSATCTAQLSSNQFLTDQGASLGVGWGARPLVVGQWGWSAPQQGASWDESQPLETGAKLGDLVLVAEQRIGDGRLVVLGGNALLSNEGLVHSYSFVGNLFAYLAHDRPGPQAWWRQLLGALFALTLVVLLARQEQGLRLVGVGVVLCVGTAAAVQWSERSAEVIPSRADRGVAYIDQSHLEPYSLEDWGFDGINGLALNLMRNGYLPLMLPEITPRRLQDADLFISIAPSRSFTPSEQEALESFVSGGGILICTVGAEQAPASAQLLARFGLQVPASPVPTGGTWIEPEPFGRTRSQFQVATADADYEVAVRMHAAWPVESLDQQAQVIANGRNRLRVVASDTELPVIMAREFGSGAVILIGDTGFAMNKNLEYVTGDPFDGGYENAHFWRWLFNQLSGQSEWIPPQPADQAGETAEEGNQ
jgi:hypothetical protein